MNRPAPPLLPGTLIADLDAYAYTPTLSASAIAFACLSVCLSRFAAREGGGGLEMKEEEGEKEETEERENMVAEEETDEADE